MLEASVIVPARASATEVAELLEHLERQTIDRDRFEILIVDDHSEPPLATAALRLTDARGSYAARNAGIRAARGKVLAFTDVDCRPEPSWLQAGLTAVAAHPRAAGRIELTAGEPPTWIERLDRARFLRQRQYVAEGFGATANLFVRREVFDAIGLFDERLLSGGDAELGRRAAAFPIVFAADAVVRHPCRSDARALLSKAHRVGIGFGQTIRFHGFDTRAPKRASDRLTLLSQADPLLAAGLLALHGATLLGVARGYIRAKDALRRGPGAR